MKLSLLTNLFQFLALAAVTSLHPSVTTITVVTATSFGAGGCAEGVAAPIAGHGGESSGSVEDAGYTLVASPVIANNGGEGEYTVTLSGGPEFKGFLFRTALGSEIIDAGESGQEASACLDTAVGVTHADPTGKTEVTATFMAPEGATSAVVDVSVLVAFSEYYYTGLTVDLVAAAEDDAEPVADPDVDPDVDPDAVVDDTETDLDPVEETGVEDDADPEPDAASVADDTETEADPKDDTETDTDPMDDTETETDPKDDTETETDQDLMDDTETDPDTMEDTAETDPDPMEDTETEPMNDADTETAPDAVETTEDATGTTAPAPAPQTVIDMTEAPAPSGASTSSTMAAVIAAAATAAIFALV